MKNYSNGAIRKLAQPRPQKNDKKTKYKSLNCFTKLHRNPNKEPEAQESGQLANGLSGISTVKWIGFQEQETKPTEITEQSTPKLPSPGSEGCADKKLNIFLKLPTEEDKVQHPFVGVLGVKPAGDGYIEVRGVMDSGASESVAPPSMCPHVKITPSAGSLIGQKYVSASDDILPNLGEQTLDVVLPTGHDGHVTYQMADVARPLNSVSQICDGGGDAGQIVIFGRHGGTIVNLESGSQTPFQREQDGVYSMNFWVKPEQAPTSVFPRPGR
jgi:hypothetical protein